MKLVQLTMTDFGNHKNTTIDFGPRSVFMGNHGDGKTTILDGIQFCFIAMCRAMTQRNQEKEMIREGAVKASLQLIFQTDNYDGQVFIDRAINKSTSALKVSFSNDPTVLKDTEAQEKLFELLGFGPAIAQVLFKSTTAIGMKSSELKSLLQELFTADESKIIKHLAKKGIVNLPESVQKDITAAFASGGLGEYKAKKSTGAYGYAYDKRLALSQEIKEHQALTAPAIDKETQLQDPVKIEARITTLKGERDELLKVANVDAGKSEQLKATIARLKSEIAELETSQGDATALKTANDGALAAVAIADATVSEAKGKSGSESELTTTQATLKERKVVDLKPLQATADKAAGELRTSKDDLIKLEGMAVPVTTDDRLNTAAEVLVEMGADASEQTIKALGARIAELPEFDHEKHKRDIVSVKEWIASYEKDIITIQNELTTARESNDAHIRLLDSVDDLKTKIENAKDVPTVFAANKILVDCKATAESTQKLLDDNANIVRDIDAKKAELAPHETDLASMPEATTDADEAAKAVESLDDRIAAQNKMYIDVTAWKQYETDAAAVEEKLTKAQAKHDNWDKIAEVLNPKTCDTMFLLGDSFNDFCKGFSATAKALGCPATIGTDFTITGSVERDDGLMASKGAAWLNRAQHALVGIALQMEICRLVGFRSLIVDDGDTFLGESRNKLSSMLLLKPIDNIDSVVLLSAGTPPAKPPVADGLTFYAVQVGNVTAAAVPF